MTTTTNPSPSVPLPVGATTCGWDTVNPGGCLERSLEWSSHDTEKIGVTIDGWQQATGAFTRGISMYGASEGERITAVQARALAAALINAADELDRLDGPHAVDSAIYGCCNGVGRHTPDC